MEKAKQEEGEKKGPISTSPRSDGKEEGDGNWGNLVMESERQVPRQSEQGAVSTPCSGSKKSVHWSTDLVTQSPSVASNAYGLNSHASLSPSSSTSIKGILMCGCVWFVCVSLWHACGKCFNGF